MARPYIKNIFLKREIINNKLNGVHITQVIAFLFCSESDSKVYWSIGQ
jgi:hypothetical protein